MAMAISTAGRRETQVATNRYGICALGNIALNTHNFRVAVAGNLIDLTFQELEVLKIFLAQPDHVISYADITTSIWGYSSRTSRRTLAVLIHRLRGKLAESTPYALETVRGRGYGLLKPSEGEPRRDQL